MTRLKTIAAAAAALSCAAAPALAARKPAATPALPSLPALHATCPAGLVVDADGMGMVRINGTASRLKRVNGKTVSAAVTGGIVVSLSVGDDGQPVVSTTGPGRARASCTLTDPAAAAAAAAASAAPATTPPSAAEASEPRPIAPILRATYCRGEVAGKLAARPEGIHMDRPIAEPGGGTQVQGTVDLGSDGAKAFTCQFDGAGRWVALKLQ